MSEAICGICGIPMKVCDVTPCLDCGADPKELDHWTTHRYTKFGIFDDEMLCDFCNADMASTDPLLWGFPAALDWDSAMSADFTHSDHPPPLRKEYACASCGNSLRKQEFILRNARRNAVVLPRKYWPCL